MGFVPTPKESEQGRSGERRSFKVRGPGMLLGQLSDPRPLARRWAVRDLAAFPKVAVPLLEFLLQESDASVREVIFTTLLAIGGDVVTRGLLPLLQSEDPGLRQGAVELLQQLPLDRSFLMDDLLREPEPAIRLQVVKILRDFPNARVVEWVRELLGRDQSATVCAAAMGVLAEVGDKDDVALINRVQARFSDDPYLLFASDAAIHLLEEEDVGVSQGAMELFRSFFHRKTSIVLQDLDCHWLQPLLQSEMDAIGVKGIRGFLAYLRCDPFGAEMVRLVDAARVALGEGREGLCDGPQNLCLVRHLLDETVKFKKPGEPLRLWAVNAGANGEAFALMLQVLQGWSALEKTPVSMIVSEQVPERLEVARSGVFEADVLAQLPGDILERHFTPLPGNQSYRIDKTLHDAVEFRLLDLHDSQQTRSMRGFDVIVCRGVLSRLDLVARRRLSETFFDALLPGGFLLLGVGESMSRISSLFKVRGFPESTVFQKPRS